MTYHDDNNDLPPQELTNTKKFNFLIGQNTYQTINEKKNQLQRLKEEKNNLILNFDENYRSIFYKNELTISKQNKILSISTLKEELKKYNLKVKQSKLIKSNIAYYMNSFCQGQDDLKTIIGRIIEKKQEMLICKEKIEKWKDMVKKSENLTITKTNNEFNILKTRLVEYEKQRIMELNKQIFDLTEIKQKEEDYLQKSTRTALKDARQTVYVNGRWILANDHVIYRIIKSILPTEGDYFSYLNDSQQKDFYKNKEDPQEEMERNVMNNRLTSSITLSSSNNSLSNATLTNSLIAATYKSIDRRTILSGLTHTVQFVNLIAFYLNILLPYNLPHNKFFNQSLTSDQFQNAIAKLNTNIVYLSIHQHIPVTNLLPKQTLENLYHFINYFQEMRIKLREKHSISFPDHLVPMMEEMFSDTNEDNLMEDSMPNILFSTENDEWETVPSSNEIPSDDTYNSTPSRNVSSSLISSVLSQLWFSKNNKQT